jgi:hypothetical protein
MEVAQVSYIEDSKEGKKCHGVGCRGECQPLDQFYTKGRKGDGSPRYESICKKCKASVGKKRRDKIKKQASQAKKNIKIDIRTCVFPEEEDDDFVKEDHEKFLKDFAYDLIFE